MNALDLATIARALGGEVNAGQVLAPGPGHSAADRSMAVKPDDAAPEGFLVHSFAGDDPVECKDHVRKKLGLPKREPKEKANGKSGKAWTTISEHVYRSETGEPYLRVRKCLDDKGKKQYHQAYWNGKQWVKGKPKGQRIPYLLPQLIAAPPCVPVFFTEGEKCADALAALGFVATTVSEGAEAKWPAEAAQYFRDRVVVILPDNDPPGGKHARKVERALKSVAASVRIFDLAPHWPGTMPTGKDIFDWLNVNPCNKDRLIDLATAKPPACDGDDLLNEVRTFLARFVAYPSEHELVAHSLWIVHTHLMDAWESTPRIAFLSPEPSSGKTRALEISELLVPRPVEAVNVTPAYLFREVGAEDGRPTILYDEIDTVFSKAKENEEIRGLLNAGHRRGAVAGRCVVRGKIVETEEIPAYCAVALAGLGGLPDTILSRAVIVRMRRRAPTESIESYRRREHGPEGEQLRLSISLWAESIIEAATDARPTMPDGVADRDADIWEPLLAVADAASGTWPQRARVASVALVALSKESTPSLGIRLLADLHQIFGDAEVMSTETILHHLRSLDESPWNDIKGKPLSDRGLANRLRTYQIKSKVVRIGEQTPRGYAREDLHDAWVRYLHVGPPPHRSATSATCATEPPRCASCGQPSRPDDPLSEVADGQRFGLVHRDCFDAWMAA